MEQELLQIAKNDSETKIIIKEKLTQIKDMNIATRSELALKLLIDSETVKSALLIAGDTINDLSIENEILTEKNEELEKHLTQVDKDKINNIFTQRRKQIESDNVKGERILKAVRKTLSKSKQLTDK